MIRRMLLALILFLAFPAYAVEPSEMLKDKTLEQRARDVSRNLRCLVCRGEDIDSSHAELAADLRRLVRERIVEGDTDDQIYAYLRARYGDYVLMRPPMEGKTTVLWLAPVVVFCAGFAVVLLRRAREGMEK